MYNILTEEQCQRLNTIVEQHTKNNEGVNFIRFLTCEKGHKCSMVLSQKEISTAAIYITNTCSLICEDNNFYYGLHPSMNTKTITRAIAEGRFKDIQTVLAFMNETSIDKPIFKLHAKDRKFLTAMFASSLIKMSNKFGIRMRIDNYETIKRKIEAHPLYSSDIIRFQEDTRCALFPGGINTFSIALLQELALGYTFNNHTLYLTKQGTSIDQIYKIASQELLKHIALVEDHVYYSGVMPRTVQIEKDNQYYNHQVDTFHFIVERTTFAMLDVMDYCAIAQHPMLSNFRTDIECFYKQEDDAQKTYLCKAYKSQEELLENINAYLKISPNTHTIAVSGNIETSDDFLVFGKRNNKSIDKNTLYPSINGQSEFKDPFPEIYRSSVYEDYPTLNFFDEYRLDFEGEINRETYAELNVKMLDASWQYYGFSFLMIRNDDKEDIAFRRMHFNILGKNYTKETFLSVVEAREYATEKFENHSIVGLGIRPTRLRTTGKRLATFIIKNIEDFAAIIIGFTLSISLIFNNLGSYEWSLQTFLDLVLPIIVALAVLLLALKKAGQQLKERKSTKDFLQYVYAKQFNDSMDHVDTFIDRLITSKKNQNYHAISILMASLYYMYRGKEL